jgi:hypothetical protein
VLLTEEEVLVVDVNALCILTTSTSSYVRSTNLVISLVETERRIGDLLFDPLIFLFYLMDVITCKSRLVRRWEE